MTTTDNGYLQSKRFLDTLFSHYFGQKDGFIELRFIAKGSDAQSIFYRLAEFGENDWAEVTKLNQTHQVYIGVNPRPLSKNKRQDDIEDMVCLWADLDGKNYDGGKVEALQRIQGFKLQPSITVDSGHGYHCYWNFSEPIVGLAGEDRLQFKKILSGIVKVLGGDRQKLHLDSCLRLPGTVNSKDPAAPVECRLMNLSGRAYAYGEFSEFLDADYEDAPASEIVLPQFGSRTKIISVKDLQSAQADVNGLDIPARTKKLIITGSLLREKGQDRSRSARDFSIILSLLHWGYDYQTIRSIFFNPLLGCSNRVSSEGEDVLRWDVHSALSKVKRRWDEGTEQSRDVARTKGGPGKGEEKRVEIAAYIVNDLLAGPNPAGEGFKDRENNVYYFFERSEKMLMALEGSDFYCFMRDRFGLSKKDFDEYKDSVMTAIWKSDKVVVPRRFSYWDRERFNLYISNHDNGVYRLSGDGIELCDNGVDGVFFEYDPCLVPFKFDPNIQVVDYFKEVSGAGPGLDIARFEQDDCLLKRYLLDRASFAQNQVNNLSPEAQRLLLIIYFYSLFFESQMREKPVACFLGTKESGKSFLATSVGKILFGDNYESSGLPKSAHDLAVVMGKWPYLVIDNLDSYLKSDMLNLLCAVATGAMEANRTLYTDRDMTQFTPHCYLAITSREPKFARDDFVSRLLIFSMQQITNPISRSELIESLVLNRSAILTEVLTNLNSIVRILALSELTRLESGRAWEPMRCYSRLADWETFGAKICNRDSLAQFQSAVRLMNTKKDEFVLEDDYLYMVLTNCIYEEKKNLVGHTAQQLYLALLEIAQDMCILEEFKKSYKSARSLAKRLANIINELKQKFVVEITEERSRGKKYSFSALDGQSENSDRRPSATNRYKKNKAGKEGILDIMLQGSTSEDKAGSETDE